MLIKTKINNSEFRKKNIKKNDVGSRSSCFHLYYYISAKINPKVRFEHFFLHIENVFFSQNIQTILGSRMFGR